MSADFPNRVSLRGVIALFLVFAFGAVCGAALFHLGRTTVLRELQAHQRLRPERPPRPREGPDGRPRRERGEGGLVRDLGLEPEQEREVLRVLRESRERIDDVLEETRKELGTILTEEQQQQFDQLHPPPPPPRRPRHRRPDRRRPGDRPPPPPPPPPPHAGR